MAVSEENMPFFIIIPAACVAALASVMLYVYLGVFHNKKRRHPTDPYAGLSSKYLEGMREVVRAQIDDISAYPCEEIALRSYDGLELFGRFYEGCSDKPVVIMLHGYKGSSYTEISGAALMMISHGLGVIAADHRSHGRSEGGTVSFGVKERRDVLSWVDYVKKRFGGKRRVILYGISMGAATALMASELLNGEDVCCIIADCPYSSPRAIICRVIKNKGLAPRVIYPLVYLSALVYGRFRLSASSPKEAVKNTDIPILLIHGEADDFVPCEMSREIKAAARNAELFTVEGAKHGACFATAGEKYVERVLSFVDKYTR